jgi:Tfp pilus assembly protein PilO
MAMKLPIALSGVKVQGRPLYLLAATGLLAVALVTARFLYLPAVNQIRQRQVALEELRVKMANVQHVQEELPRQEAAVRQATQRYRALQARLGEGQSVARILEELDGLAKSKRLQFLAKQSSAEDGQERRLTLGPEIALRETPLTVQLTGRYRQVAEFLGQLRQAPFVASVQQLSLTKIAGEGSRLQADLSLAVYLAERMPKP